MKGGRVILLIDIVLIIKSFWRFINMFLFQVFVQVYILCDTFANSQTKLSEKNDAKLEKIVSGNILCDLIRTLST